MSERLEQTSHQRRLTDTNKLKRYSTSHVIRVQTETTMRNCYTALEWGKSGNKDQNPR